MRLQKAHRKRFHAFHKVMDTGTLMIHATRVKTRPGGDSRFMVPLIRRVMKRGLEAVYCDKVHISRRNVHLIADVGAYPVIEPKSSSSINSKGH